jgi:hypothetical protein
MKLHPFGAQFTMHHQYRICGRATELPLNNLRTVYKKASHGKYAPQLWGRILSQHMKTQTSSHTKATQENVIITSFISLNQSYHLLEKLKHCINKTEGIRS